jgi:hypothetical protein
VLRTIGGPATLVASPALPLSSEPHDLRASISLLIDSHVPLGYQFHLTHRMSTVVVAPLVPNRLIYYSLYCDGGKLGTTYVGARGWEQLSDGAVLKQPNCDRNGQTWSMQVGAPPGSKPLRTQWNVLVGAPGYAVASGQY